ncbi:MAG: hypothetical protein ABI920_15745 [Casimicrobiaceae bacterium]
MILTVTLPCIMAQMQHAIVRRPHGIVGTEMHPGAKLVDISIDLSAVAPHDCPPVSLFRIAIRERAWLRTFDLRTGDAVAPGIVLAWLTTDPDEPMHAPGNREARFAVAGIAEPAEWWLEDT